ncbi:MAG: hypothetical protein ACIARR_04575 [Phycisphaerales bacterium JB059]
MPPHLREPAFSRFLRSALTTGVVLCSGLGLPGGCAALPAGRPAIAPVGGLSRELPLPWAGLEKSLQPTLDPLHLRVFIVERPDPDWMQVELLDLGGRSISLRFHRLPPTDLAPHRVEVRCSAGRLGDPALEREILDQLARSAPDSPPPGAG